MKSNHKVSIIVPVYNGSNYLKEAIDSALAQTYFNTEIIVVNDGSTDNGETERIALSYGDKIRYFYKANGGVASALNLGIKEMTGDYFAWLSHDDLWLPQKLALQVAFLESYPLFKACYTDYLIIDAQGAIIGKQECPWHPRPQSILKLFGRMYIGGCTMLIERTCFERVGLFNEALRTTQDADMWFRLLNHFEIGHLNEALTKERQHSMQGSRSLDCHEEEKAATYQRIFEEIGLPILFPQLTQAPDHLQPQIKAKGYTWLGDTMAYHRHWFAFAGEQYRKALALYPTWRNPALIKLIGNQGLHAACALYKWIRHILSHQVTH